MDYKFNDKPERKPLLPPGDYRVEVIAVEYGISKGKATGGSDTIELKLKVMDEGNTIYDTLILHQDTDWRIDQFLKATSGAQKDQKFNLSENFLVGLRAWATLKEDKYTNSVGVEKINNKVVRYIVDKPVPRAGKPEPISEANDFAAEDDVPF